MCVYNSRFSKNSDKQQSSTMNEIQCWACPFIITVLFFWGVCFKEGKVQNCDMLVTYIIHNHHQTIHIIKHKQA